VATGFATNTTKQAGEYLVAAELAKKKYVVATFAGNVPEYDLIVADEKGRSIPVQVKAIWGGDWHFRADRFMHIEFDEESQTQKGFKSRRLKMPDLIFVFVVLSENHDDRFFLLTQKEVRDIIVDEYRSWMKKIGGRRPRNPRSMHTIIRVRQIEMHENKWVLIDEMMRKAG